MLPMLFPVSAENSTPPPTAISARRPRSLPNHLSRASRRSNPMPEWNMISPIRRKSATGTRVKLVSDSEIWMTSCSIPGTPPKIK